MAVKSEKISIERLESAEAVLSLGVVVVRELKDLGIATLFLNGQGQVELCPRGEVELDALTEDTALAALLDRGYGDEQLMAYLRGRKAREGHRGPHL